MKENVLERNARMDTDRKIADFRVKQQMDYAFKMKYARIRAWEFYNHPDVAGNCYVAVGGLDSITLLLFLRSIGIDVPAVSVSSLEDKSIQRVHKQRRQSGGIITRRRERMRITTDRQRGCARNCAST